MLFQALIEFAGSLVAFFIQFVGFIYHLLHLFACLKFHSPKILRSASASVFIGSGRFFEGLAEAGGAIVFLHEAR